MESENLQEGNNKLETNSDSNTYDKNNDQNIKETNISFPD